MYRGIICLLFLISLPKNQGNAQKNTLETPMVEYIADPLQQRIVMFWKDENGQLIRSLKNLKSYSERKKHPLLFAMNGGMYKTDNSPLGLWIDEGKEIHAINTASGTGNFYLKPNGVFLVTQDGKADVVATSHYRSSRNIRFATQSGPMLVYQGVIHPEFKKGSSHVHIRNGVGILPNGKVLFAMTKTPVSLYDFATYFQRKGCKQALYLDGFVSRCYAPSQQWIQEDGNFGVMIGVEKK